MFPRGHSSCVSRTEEGPTAIIFKDSVKFSESSSLGGFVLSACPQSLVDGGSGVVDPDSSVSHVVLAAKETS